eukprot:3941843-Rhodomonas_salina.2
MRPHFAHPRGAQKKEGCALRHLGCGGGETVEHLLAKQLLRDHLQEFCFEKEQCDTCHVTDRVVFPAGCRVILECRTDGSLLRPDVTVHTPTGRRWALEVFHTHQSSFLWNLNLLHKGLHIAEFKASEVIEKLGTGRARGQATPLLNNILKGVLLATCRECRERVWWDAEWREAAAYDLNISAGYKQLAGQAALEEETRQRVSHALSQLASFEAQDLPRMHCAKSEAGKALEAIRGRRFPFKRGQYEVGFRKCATCRQWKARAEGDCEESTEMFYDRAFHGRVWLCYACQTHCYACHSWAPLEQVAQFGRCLECSVKVHRMREAATKGRFATPWGWVQDSEIPEAACQCWNCQGAEDGPPARAGGHGKGPESPVHCAEG